MNTFTHIVAIVKKDSKSLQPLILLTIGMVMTEIVITDLDALASASSLIRMIIPYISFLTSAILLVSVVQLDPASSLTHDWLTRPIPKRELFLAKITFLLLYFLVPLVLTRVLVNIANGLPLTESFSAAFIVNGPWLLLAYATIWCIAVLSKSSLQSTGITLAFIVGLVIIATVIPLFPTTGGAGSERTFTSTIWVSALFLTLITLLTLLLVPWLQYSKRRFNQAFILFAGAYLMACLAIFLPFSAPTWAAIFSFQKLTVDQSGEKLSDNLKFDFARGCFPASYIGNFSGESREPSQRVNAGYVSDQVIGLAWGDHQLKIAGSGAVAFSTTVIGRGLPLNNRYVVLKATADYTSDSLPEPVRLAASGQPIGNRLDRFGNSATHYWLVPEKLVAKLGHDSSTQLKLNYDIALLSPTTYELEMDSVRRDFPKLGSCSAKRDERSNRVEIDCFKRGEQPALVSAELKDIPASRIDAGNPSYTPGWMEFWNGKHYELTVSSPSLINNNKVVLRAYDAVEFTHREKVVSGFIGESNSCSLAQDTHHAQFSWSDPSPHRASFISVDQDVRLEVLDWGGPESTNNDVVKTLVLLPGAGATAHSYDNVAPILAEQYRVIGITRRGFGASSKPDFGYNVDRLALDVVKILDALDIQSPILVGHSYGGEELSAIAADYPDRASALIYLDAAYDRASYQDRDDETAFIRSFPPAPRPSRADLSSYDAILKYMDRHNLDHLPPGELMASYDMASGSRKIDPRIGNALMAGVKRPEYEKIQVPALAIYAVATSSEHLIKPWFDLSEPGLKENIEEYFQVRNSRQREQIENFQKQVANSDVIELKNADHWVFVSNPNDVFEAINNFIAKLDSSKATKSE